MSNAKLVLCADDFTTNKTLHLIDKLRTYANKIYIENTFQPHNVCWKMLNRRSNLRSFYEFHYKNPQQMNIIAKGSKKNSESINLIFKYCFPDFY